MEIRGLYVVLVIVVATVAGRALDRTQPHNNVAKFYADTPLFEETHPNSFTVCYGVLGCFGNRGGFADFLHRPVQPLPNPPSTIQTSFTLVTREHETHTQQLVAWDPHSIKASNFSASRKTKFIIHGYMNNRHSPWVMDMAKALLSVGDYNVVLVDWVLGSVNLYQQSAVDTRVVGAQVWYLCSKLSELKGMKNKDVHIIGHSLGAHIAGYAGQRIPGLARISGLDPAQPYFQGMDPVVRLDPTDAEFVDVIHTDGDSFVTSIGTGGYGMSQACGHVDFYPNGGRDQPECDTEDTIATAEDIGLIQGLRHFLTCNHMRAVYLYTESIKQNNSSCQFTSFPCRDYETFLDGHCGYCGKRCGQMGFYSDQSDKEFMTSKENTYFLRTAGYPLYCRHNYIVNMLMEKDMELAKGRIYLTIDDGKLSTGLMELTDQPTEIYRHHSFVVATNLTVTEDTKLTLKWKASPTYFGLGILGYTGREKLHLDFLVIDGPRISARGFKNAFVKSGSSKADGVKITRLLEDEQSSE